MIKSMTGYGRAQQVIDGRDITVEIKTVNHRFFELSCRTPRIYGFIEEKIKSFIQTAISRGKVEVNVLIQSVENSDASVQIDEKLAGEYIVALRGVGQKFSLVDDISLSSISRFNDIFVVKKETPDEALIWTAVKLVAQVALDNLVDMREREGANLLGNINDNINDILSGVKNIEKRSPQTVSEYRERIFGKMKEVLQDRQIDEVRLLTEVAIFCEKITVDEETVRIKSHLKQFDEILKSDEPIGRKLDFLVQEINREVNTIGSKANDVEIAAIVVNIKSQIEKIREQIQNIE